MTPPRPHPDLWYPIVQVLVTLRRLLRATAPDAFASISLDARAHLAALAALVRRYIHILAAELALPPLRPLPPLPDIPAERTGERDSRFRLKLVEEPRPPRQSGSGEDPPDLQWDILMEAVQRLAEVLRDPLPHARRLARSLRRRQVPSLRELPVPWHIIRRIGPGLDTLLNRLDALARPEAWEGMDTS